MRNLLLVAAVSALVGATPALAAKELGTPGEPNCHGQSTAFVAQLHKEGEGVPAGYGPAARFFGFSPKEGHAFLKEFCAGGDDDNG